jgi:hypothetical protein
MLDLKIQKLTKSENFPEVEKNIDEFCYQVNLNFEFFRKLEKTESMDKMCEIFNKDIVKYYQYEREKNSRNFVAHFNRKYGFFVKLERKGNYRARKHVLVD